MKKNFSIIALSALLFVGGCANDPEQFERLKMMSYQDLNSDQLLTHLEDNYVEGLVDSIYENRADEEDVSATLAIHKSCIVNGLSTKLNKKELEVVSLVYAENKEDTFTALAYAGQQYGFGITNSAVDKAMEINFNCLSDAAGSLW